MKMSFKSKCCNGTVVPIKNEENEETLKWKCIRCGLETSIIMTRMKRKVK